VEDAVYIRGKDVAPVVLTGVLGLLHSRGKSRCSRQSTPAGACLLTHTSADIDRFEQKSSVDPLSCHIRHKPNTAPAAMGCLLSVCKPSDLQFRTQGSLGIHQGHTT
jgi:hypothetical protein